MKHPRVRPRSSVPDATGVYASLDSGAEWVSLCTNLPTAAVVDLAVHAREPALVAVTHGLSAFLLDIGPLREALP